MTDQYAGLRTLYEENKDDGFTVLGFPCNQFGAQEPGSDAEVLAFAQSKYGIDFPMFSKVEVNGDGACDLYKFLTSAKAAADGRNDISWNFAKFLVDRAGNVAARFEPKKTPEEIGTDLDDYV